MKYILFIFILSIALHAKAERRAILELFRSGPHRSQERYIIYDAEKGGEELMTSTNALNLETKEVGLYRRPTRNTAELLNDLLEKDGSPSFRMKHALGVPFPIHDSWHVYVLGREFAANDPRRAQAIQILLDEVKKSGWQKLDTMTVTLSPGKAAVQRTVTSAYSAIVPTHPKSGTQTLELRKACTRDEKLLRCATDSGYIFFNPK